MSEWKAATSTEVVPRLAPYLADFDENVRFAAIDGIALHEPTLIAEPIVTSLLRPDEESVRIKRALIDVVVAKQLPLGEHKAKVGELLTGVLAGFKITGETITAR